MLFERKFKTAKEFLEKIEEYFDITDAREQTRAGLCLFLGITKNTLYNYKCGDQGDDFKEAAEWACTRLEHKYELDLNNKRNPAGSIFALKQYGWKNNHDVEVKGTGAISIVTNIPRPKED
jgi:hypothetical protein